MAGTDAPEEYEDALLDAFAAGVPEAHARRRRRRGGRRCRPAGRAAVGGPAGAVRRAPGDRDRQPADARGGRGGPAAGPRIVELPPAEADGARDEAKRGRRPAPGRGTGRVASAAAYAAQGSPRKAPPEPVYVSPEGLMRLQAELAGLVAERPDVIRRIATAREHGDLKENAEYHAAREEQGFLEGRIKALEGKLKVAVVTEPTERGAKVELGSHVRVETDGEEVVLRVVGVRRGELARGPDLAVSPVGAALMGRRVGDAVTIVTPGGEIRYMVLGIE